MTVITGILCSDGVVIGSDSAMAAGRAGRYTIEWQESGALKLEIFEPDIITAVTGAFGLAQRFNDVVGQTLKVMRQPFKGPQLIPGLGEVGSLLQKILGVNVQNGQVPYDKLAPVELGRVIAQMVIADFQRTPSVLQSQPGIGWGLGALFAFVNDDKPQLIDFDPVQFHPELKGMPDPLRGDKDRIWRCVSMGAGQQLADPFLAHAYHVLFGDKVPTVDRAKLAVAWTIHHVKSHNIGLVGGTTQLAVLEKSDGRWHAHHEDPGQALQQVRDLEDYISKFGPAAIAPSASVVDPHAEIDMATSTSGAAPEEEVRFRTAFAADVETDSSK